MNIFTEDILAMWAPGPVEMIVILVIVVLIFGRRLPKIARDMGRSLFEFKKGIKEGDDTRTDGPKNDDTKDDLGN